jgi:hypothetical protein
MFKDLIMEKIVSLRSAIAQEANAGMKKGGPKAAPPQP